MSRWTLAGCIGIAALAAGCSQAHDPIETGIHDTVTDTDDTDDPVDTDDTDDTGPQDTGDPVDTGPDFCDLPLWDDMPGQAGLGDCITRELSCGDSVESTNDGGSLHYDKDMYEDWHCASTESATSHFDAAERVYQFVLPPNTKAYLTLEKECDRNLEMRAFRRMDGDACPTMGNNLVFCERDASAGTFDNQTIELTAVNNAGFYDVVIDGRNGAIANFRLSIECE